MSTPYSFMQTMIDVPYDMNVDGIDQGERFLRIFKCNINRYEDTDEKLRPAIHLYYLFKFNLDYLKTVDPHKCGDKKSLSDKLLSEARTYNNTQYPNHNFDFITIPEYDTYPYGNMDHVESEITYLERHKEKHMLTNCGTVLTDNIEPLPTLGKFADTFDTTIHTFDRVKIFLPICDVLREHCINIFAQYLQTDVECTSFGNIPFLRTEVRNFMRYVIFKGRLSNFKLDRPYLKNGEVYKNSFTPIANSKSCVEYSVDEFDISKLNLYENIEPYKLTCVYIEEDVRVGFNHKGRQIEIENPQKKFSKEITMVLPYLRDHLWKNLYLQVMSNINHNI